MTEYSQGIMNDGPVILKDGQPMTLDEIVNELNQLQDVLNKIVELYESVKTRTETKLKEEIKCLRGIVDTGEEYIKALEHGYSFPEALKKSIRKI